MAVTVDTPEGTVTGASVRQVWATDDSVLLPDAATSVRLKGQAVIVDLGRRGKLFALLSDKKGYGYAIRVVHQYFPYKPIRRGLTPEHIRYYSSLKNTKAVLFEDDSHSLPRLVRFRDLNDPKTVELVDPDGLERSFGEGVRLKMITIEMTDEDVTHGIENVLPWLPDKKNFRGSIGGDSKPPYYDSTYTYLSIVDFVEGGF